MRTDETLELRWIFSVLRRWWWLIAGSAAAVLLIAVLMTSRQPPVYKATATLLVAPREQANTSEYNTLMAGERLALTYVQMLTGRSNLQAAIARMASVSGLSADPGDRVTTPEALAKKIEAAPVKDTQLVRVTAADTSPARAALIANTVAEVFTDYSKTLEQDRYQSELRSKEAKIGAQAEAIEETQAQIDAASAKKAAEETELARVQALLDEYRATDRSLQGEHDALQQQLAGVMYPVKIVEAPRRPAAGGTGAYTATLTLLIESPAGVAAAGVAAAGALAPAAGANAGTDAATEERQPGTYAEMITGRPVLEAAIVKLGNQPLGSDQGAAGEGTVDELERAVRAEQVPGTRLIRLRVRGTDPQQAAALANAIAEAFIDQLNQLVQAPYSGRLANLQAEMASLAALIDQTQAAAQVRAAASLQTGNELARLEDLLAQARGDYHQMQQDYEQLRLTASQAPTTVVLTERAPEPRAPADNGLVYILLAVAIAGVVAIAAAFFIEYLQESIKTAEDVSRGLGLSTLGTIELFDDARAVDGAEMPIAAAQPSSSAAEAFRMLATNVRLTSASDKISAGEKIGSGGAGQAGDTARTILVTSAAPFDGKSVVAANLAVAMAGAGLRVVIVDADLRRPRQHEVFGLTQGQGLTYALWQGSIDGHLKPSGVEGVMVLTSGAIPDDPVALLTSPRMKKMLDELARQADLIILDTPPVLAVADTTILAAEADAALLVVRSGRTATQAARRAFEALRQTKTPLLGVVLNGVPPRSGSYYTYYQAAEETEAHRPEPRNGRSLWPLRWRPGRNGSSTSQPMRRRASVQARSMGTRSEGTRSELTRSERTQSTQG